MKVKYTGPADESRFTQADFTRHDVQDQSAVHFNAKNKFTAEVSDDAGALLIKLNTDFEEVKSESGDESSDAAAPKAIPNDSVDDEDAESVDSDMTVSGDR